MMEQADRRRRHQMSNATAGFAHDGLMELFDGLHLSRFASTLVASRGRLSLSLSDPTSQRSKCGDTRMAGWSRPEM